MSFERVVNNLIWAILYMAVFSNIERYLTRTNLSMIVVNVLEWVLFLALVVYVLRISGFIPLKILIYIFVTKVAVYAYFYHQYSFQKGIVVAILLTVFLYTNSAFGHEIQTTMKSRLWLLVLLTVLTFVPFYGWYNRYSFVMAAQGETTSRFSGLWDLPHAIGYFFLGFITLQEEINPIYTLVLTGLIVLTGVRSALLALGIYLSMRVLLTKYFVSYDVRSRRRAFLQSLSLLLVGTVAWLTPQVKSIFLPDLIHQFKPLLQQSVTSPGYGKGRVQFIEYVLTKVKHFDILSLIVGRSATELYLDFKDLLGIKSWPHDDFLTALYIDGIYGLALYIYYVYLWPLRVTWGAGRFHVFAVAMAMGVLAVTNGLYTYYAMYLFLLAGAYFAWNEIVDDYMEDPSSEGLPTPRRIGDRQ